MEAGRSRSLAPEKPGHFPAASWATPQNAILVISVAMEHLVLNSSGYLSYDATTLEVGVMINEAPQR
jgi:hypothetical protein